MNRRRWELDAEDRQITGPLVVRSEAYTSERVIACLQYALSVPLDGLHRPGVVRLGLHMHLGARHGGVLRLMFPAAFADIQDPVALARMQTLAGYAEPGHISRDVNS